MRKKLARWVLATLVTCSFAYAFVRWGTGRDDGPETARRFEQLRERYLVPYAEEKEATARREREVLTPLLARLRAHDLEDRQDVDLVTGVIAIDEFPTSEDGRAELLATYQSTLPFARDVEEALDRPEVRNGLAAELPFATTTARMVEVRAWVNVLRLHAYVACEPSFGLDAPDRALDRIEDAVDLAEMLDNGTLIGAMIRSSTRWIALDALRDLVASGAIPAREALARFEAELSGANGPDALRTAMCTEFGFLAEHPPTAAHRRTCEYPELCDSYFDTVAFAVEMIEANEVLWREEDVPVSERDLVFTEPSHAFGLSLLQTAGVEALLLLELELRAYREEHGAWPAIDRAPVVLDPNTCAPIAVARHGDALRLGPIHTIEVTFEPRPTSNVFDARAWARVFGSTPTRSSTAPRTWEEAAERRFAVELR